MSTLRAALAERVVVADGAMGTMLQASDATVDDFEASEGCNDALIIETCQDLLQAKAAIIGARRAVAELAPDALVIAQVTIETTGTMLLGTEIGAALTALEPLGIDMIGLNCATGPGEMSEHLRYLAAHARVPISCEPNAGLPVLTSDDASYPLTPAQLADAHDRFSR